MASLEVDDDRLIGVRLEDGRVLPAAALVVATRMVARASFPAELGVLPTEHPLGIGEHIPAEPTGGTGVRGVWVGANITDPAAQVGTSATAGTFAGAQINADLVREETRTAVEAYRPAASASS